MLPLFRDWCLMNTVQLFCINDSTWCPIIGRNFSRSLWPSAVLRKQLGKQNLTLSNSRFHNLFIDILLCGGFLENSARANFFWRTPAKVWSTLIITCRHTASERRSIANVIPWFCDFVIPLKHSWVNLSKLSKLIIPRANRELPSWFPENCFTGTSN